MFNGYNSNGLKQIRVSSRISNGPIILNIDCDHYSNNSQSVRDALCFFMEDKQGHDIAYVQYPQRFNNITKNDLYGSYLRVPTEVRVNNAASYINSYSYRLIKGELTIMVY